MGDWLTLKEAAERWQVSTRTVRRWIDAGRVQAEKHAGPFGPEWRIPAGQIEAPAAVRDVVTLDRPVDMAALAKALDSYLQQQHADLRQALDMLAAENAALRAELAQLRTELSGGVHGGRADVQALRAALEARDQALVAEIRATLAERRRQHAWWQFWKWGTDG